MLNITRALIEQALRIWRPMETVFNPEIARSTFLMAKVLRQSGAIQQAVELFKEARELRNRVPSAPKKEDVSLGEADFDVLVTFFSR